ncbi:MAG: hypothetical protein GX279_03540 [Clostridiaceae bacterium]|nr:hypothetical protein [Clostridiaceae bacterium]
MSLDKYKIKIKKGSEKICGDAPQYSITYKSNLKNASSISHEILSAFIGSNDVIIEINSDMNGPEQNQNDPVAAFLDKTGTFDLAYRKKKVLSEKGKTVLGFAIGSKKQACEALIYVPNSVWHHPDMKKCLPLYGAKYYLTDEITDAPAKLNEIAGMSEEDRVEAFGIMIFDLAIYGQMGVLTKALSMDEIKEMLGS